MIYLFFYYFNICIFWRILGVSHISYFACKSGLICVFLVLLFFFFCLGDRFCFDFLFFFYVSCLEICLYYWVYSLLQILSIFKEGDCLCYAFFEFVFLESFFQRQIVSAICCSLSYMGTRGESVLVYCNRIWWELYYQSVWMRHVQSFKRRVHGSAQYEIVWFS